MEENEEFWMDENAKLAFPRNFYEEMAYPTDYFEANEYHVERGAGYALTQIGQCVPGVIGSLQAFILRCLFFSIVQRLVVLIGFRGSLSNLLTGLLGYCLLWLHSTSQFQLLALSTYFLTTTFLIFLLKTHQYSGHCCVLLTLLFTSLCQLYCDATDFTSFRGSLMIASMKQISLAYDTKKMAGHLNFLKVFAFIFNPATLLFGPFVTFEQFFDAQNKVGKKSLKESIFSVVLSIKYLAISILFVTYSSCIADEVPHLLGLSMLHKYTTAQSYRSSQYFVCYFAMFTAHMSGFDENEAETTKWMKVEWPTSIADVVVYWNIPMHQFLHKYIFQKNRSSFGYATAMLATFLASSLLHGFNFLLTAVLLSLGFYAYAENAFRNGLSHRLNACLKSRQCGSNCQHRFRRIDFWVTSLNLIFVFLNIFHLAYLGAPFQQTEAQESGYSWSHTIRVWHEDWLFSSHLIALFMFFSSLLL